MAGGGVAVEYVPYEVLEQYQRERRCIFCGRRSFRDMVTCDKCREFSYCCIECLDLDRAKHVPQCDIISIKKGTVNLIGSTMATPIRQKAKSLDEEVGDFAANEATRENLDEDHAPSDSQTAGEPTKKRRQRKKKRRNKSQGKNTDSLEARYSSSPAQEIVTSPAGEKCGSSVVVGDKVRSGAIFGDGWWKPKSERADESGKVDDETSGATVRKQRKSRFPEYDTDTDSGDDGSRAGNSAGAGRLKESPDSSCNNSYAFKMKDNPGPNVNATGDKVKAREQSGSVEDRPAPSISDAPGEIKGGAGFDTRDQGGSEIEAVQTQDKHGDDSTTGVELVPYDKQKAGEAEAAAGGRDPLEPPKLEKCFCCRKQSYTMLKCSRCTWGRYCNKSCQKGDFPKHKEICKRTALFMDAMEKLPFRYALGEILGLDGPRLSTKLQDLSSEFEYMLFGAHRSILLQITGPYCHPFRHGVRVMDQVGATSHIMFYDPSNMYFHHVFSFGLPIPLSRCLEPGNFILLLDACSHVFLDGTVGIRVDDLQDVHFIFKD